MQPWYRHRQQRPVVEVLQETLEYLLMDIYRLHGADEYRSFYRDLDLGRRAFWGHREPAGWLRLLDWILQIFDSDVRSLRNFWYSLLFRKSAIESAASHPKPFERTL
jgi:hypothetical protein